MPRDTVELPVSPMAITLEKLLRLREVAAQANGDQSFWLSCVGHEAKMDAVLRSMGIDDYGHDTLALGEFFNLGRVDAVLIFGTDSIQSKRRYLDHLIDNLRQTREVISS